MEENRLVPYSVIFPIFPEHPMQNTNIPNQRDKKKVLKYSIPALQ